MRRIGSGAAWSLVGLVALAAAAPGADETPREARVDGPGGLALVVRMQGPYDADVPLQIVCYFRHKASGDTTLGAAVELDRRLGGAIAGLRDRGDFAGDELETLLLETGGKIRPRRLLLIGLGDESALTPETMERVGRAAYREAAKLGETRVAFAPLIRDQGVEAIPAGEVARRVARGLLEARAADLRLQERGLAARFALAEWVQEAGPAFFDETLAAVRAAVAAP